jgi:CheY-like chemotaxis protein
MPEYATGLAGRAFLVIEDDALIAMGLISYLEALDGTVRWETDIVSATDYIEGGNAIDVAIVDLNLDGRISTPVLDLLVARKIFTILCTGYEEDSIEERFRRLPRSEKPFTRQKIQNLIAAGI